MSGQNITAAWQSNLLDFRLPPLFARSWDLRSSGAAWPLLMGQTVCPDASVNRHQNTLRNLRSCTVHVANIKFFVCPANAHSSYKINKLLKSFEIIIVAPTCFGLHKPSSASPQPVLRQSYNVDIGYIYSYLKLSVLWLQLL